MASCLLENKQNKDCKERGFVMFIKVKKKPKGKMTPLGHLYNGKRMKKTWMFYICEGSKNRPF